MEGLSIAIFHLDSKVLLTHEGGYLFHSLFFVRSLYRLVESRRIDISGENFRKGEPSAEFAAEMADQFEELMSLLQDDLLSKIALAKLEGYYNQEIADQFGKSIPTIERKLRLIRDFGIDHVGVHPVF